MIQSEREARKFIDDVFTRIDHYECSTAIGALPLVDELMKKFPSLETSHRGMYEVYRREQSASAYII